MVTDVTSAPVGRGNMTKTYGNGCDALPLLFLAMLLPEQQPVVSPPCGHVDYGDVSLVLVHIHPNVQDHAFSHLEPP